MKVTSTVEETRAYLAENNNFTWGLVPTMGFLHEGHLSLVRRALKENGRVSVSIFVNPTQFGPNEDLDQYPRDVERDLRLLEKEGVDLVFVPHAEVMYPPGYQTTIYVQEVTKVLEGAARPTHFQGVTTVVAKLFNILKPQRAYFGQKDAQQTVVIRRMVQDLNFDVELIICPTVRESDGLALSSRNKYLNKKERSAATVLIKALNTAENAYQNGERNGENLRNIIKKILNDEPLARPVYISVADPVTLEELTEISDGGLFSLAVFIGKTRLIDNILIN